MKSPAGPIQGIACLCYLVLAVAAFRALGPVRSQESCPVPDPRVTLEAKWMVSQVCPCASLQPDDPACECAERIYVATIVSGLATQGIRRAEATPTFDLSWQIQPPSATPTPTSTDPPVTSVPTAVPTEHPHPSATPSAQPRWGLFVPRVTKGRK